MERWHGGLRESVAGGRLMSPLHQFDQLMHLAYYGGSLPCRSWIRARLSARGNIPILVLFYHRIADDGATLGTHSNRLFQQQIRWLQRRCDLISLEEAQRRIRSGYND